MTDNNHPITPPDELVEQWSEEWAYMPQDQRPSYRSWIATQAARWGADQELDACCEWMQDPDLNVDTYKLRAARRPKPPSLKEQALELVDRIEKAESVWAMSELNTIRRALEALPS